MSEPLSATESFCREVIATLSSPSPSANAQEMKGRIEALLPKIAESRKKLMAKSPKGRELTAEILKNASKLRDTVAESNGKLGNGVTQQLSLLETSVGKLEIYWKSFEYVTT
jgi:hypothetical protein